LREERDDGAASTEYAMLVGFIAVAVVLAISGLGTAVLGRIDSGVDALP